MGGIVIIMGGIVIIGAWQWHYLINSHSERSEESILP